MLMNLALLASSCSKKKSGVIDPQNSPNVTQETVDENQPGTSYEEEYIISEIEIIDLELEGLVDAEGNNLGPDTQIAKLKPVLSTEAGPPTIFIYEIKETEGTDYDLFLIKDGSIFSKNDILGDRRYILNIEVETGGNSFSKNMVFSISAGQIPPENPEDILLSNTAIGENLPKGSEIGSFIVIDDARNQHELSLVDVEDSPNDNNLFYLEDNKLFTNERFNFEEKNSYSITIVATNSEFTDKSLIKDLNIDVTDRGECKDLSQGGAWVQVPGDPDYGTEDFCVMKYEAKCGRLDGNVCTANIDTETPVSKPEGSPWVEVVQQQAITECASLGDGFRLISNEEWMTITANITNVGNNWSDGTVGEGVLARGHSDNNPSSACAADSNDVNAYVQTDCSGKPDGAFNQRRTHYLSTGSIIWDMSGNVRDIVNYFNDSDKPEPADFAQTYEYADVTGTGSMPKTALVPEGKAFWNPDWNSVDQFIGGYYGGPNMQGGPLQRGGWYLSRATSGLFYANLNENQAFYMIGFRCTASVPSLQAN